MCDVCVTSYILKIYMTYMSIHIHGNGKICIITNVTNSIIKYNYCYRYNCAKIITYEQNATFEVCVIQGLCEFMKSSKQLTLKDVKSIRQLSY